MEEGKKPFRDTGFARFIRDKVKPIAGDVLEIAGDITGIDAIERVGEMLNERKEQSEAAMQAHLEFERMRAQFEHEVTLKKLDMEMAHQANALEETKAMLLDVQSARSRQIEHMKITGKPDKLMGAVVITGLVLNAFVIACLVFIEIPVSNQRLADMAFGAVLTIGNMIFGYYIGSSRGSRMKDMLRNG
jgi:hypothetical protein